MSYKKLARNTIKEKTGEKVKAKILLVKDGAQVPEYQTSGASACDLHACLDKPMIIQPMERASVPTGIAIELPEGYEAQVRARSGLSFKQGLGLVNGIGTIDSDFRGEICVLVINWGTEPIKITPGMRIAQMAIARYEKVSWQTVDSLHESERADKGFGSTGH